MNRTNLLPCILLISAAAQAESSACLSDPPQIREIVNEYSQRTGKKFVLDPRVRANVTMFGLDVDDIDYDALLGILTVHGFSAIDSGDVIYIVPDVVASETRKSLGIDPE